jgi:Domain of unknown function (DUF6321)
MTAAWTRSEGKSPSGGLNAKGRASARAEGHNLKAPTKDKDNPRHDNFCSRMTGMRRKMTGAAKAADPDSRINKSLRKWGC